MNVLVTLVCLCAWKLAGAKGTGGTWWGSEAGAIMNDAQG